MTDLDPPDVRRRLGEEVSGIHHARVAYGRSRWGARLVFVTAAVLLSVLVGWSAADLLVAGSGTVGGALVGAVFAAGVLLAARALGAG